MIEICKPFLNDSLKIIQDCHKIISIKRDHFQSLYNISRGYLEIKGLLVPSSKVIHRFMYESYDLLVLESFIKLIKLLISDCDNQLSPLTFRLVYELGNRKIKVLFDPLISPKLKNLAVLTDSLADLYLTKNCDYISLYDDLRDILSTLPSREQSVFLEMYNTIKAKNHYRPNDMLIKKARKISGEAFNKANQSVVSPFCIQRLSNFTALYASFSSLLHGNPYMVKNLVDKENIKRNKMHLLSICITANLNVLYVLRKLDLLDLKRKEIDVCLASGLETREELKKKWQAIRS